MNITIEKIKRNGEITIPSNLLKKIGLKPGADILIHLNKDSIVIERPNCPVKHLRGKFKNLDIETPIHDLRKRWDAWNRKASV